MATFLATYKNYTKNLFETGSEPVLNLFNGSKHALNQFQTIQTGLDHLKPNWYGRPNPEGRKNRKLECRKIDRKAE